jgi:hypothetical protein
MRRVPRLRMLGRLIDGDAELRIVPDTQGMDTARREGAPPDPSRLARGA